MKFKTVELQQYLRFNGKLMWVIGISENHRVLHLQGVEAERCPHCQGLLEPAHISVNEGTPHFESSAEPIETIQPTRP